MTVGAVGATVSARRLAWVASREAIQEVRAASQSSVDPLLCSSRAAFRSAFQAGNSGRFGAAVPKFFSGFAPSGADAGTEALASADRAAIFGSGALGFRTDETCITVTPLIVGANHRSVCLIFG
jgi:hypothetical protein